MCSPPDTSQISQRDSIRFMPHGRRRNEALLHGLHPDSSEKRAARISNRQTCETAMLLLALAYLGGVLTILSPCILPVLPFVFARADQPFARSGLPLLVGMALMFALVATLAAVGGGWVIRANEYGRWLATAMLAVFGLTLLLPRFADHLMRPVVNAGNVLSNFAQAGGQNSSVGSSLLLGIATGLLWAPCAGPILGLVLSGAALHGASVATTLLLVAYAGGAATSLGVALLIGGRVFAAMKRSLGVGEWIRRGIGAAILCGVVAIVTGFDTGTMCRPFRRAGSNST